MAKVTISLADELLSKIDARAKALYISRSAFIVTALMQKLQADDAMVVLPELSKVMREAIEMQKKEAPYMDSTKLGAESEEARRELQG